MRADSSLGSIWKSVLKRTARGRATRGSRGPVESLEARILPTAVTLTAVSDGYASDTNRDGAYDKIDSSSAILLTRNSTGSLVGEERTLMEFDLTQFSNALTINSAKLVLNANSRTTAGGVLPNLKVFGYDGNGLVTIADATAAAAQVGQVSVANIGVQTINLDTSFIQSEGGGYLGLRLQNPTVNGNYAVFDSLESFGIVPQLVLDVSLNVHDATFQIDEHRPNGTLIGNVNPNPGSNLTFTKLSGDPTNVFNVNSATGNITVNNSSLLEFDTKQKYVLTIRATNPNGISDTFNVTINVKNVLGVNHAPTVTPATFELPEASPVGTLVGTVQSYDPDSQDPVTFKITGGNTGNAFTIDSRSGRITVANQEALNRRTQGSFNLQVTATDTRTPRLTGTASVSVILTPITNTSTSPNQVSLKALADGEADDANNDGIFESVNTTGNTINIQRGSTGVTGRRGIMEFNLAGVNASKVVENAYLTVSVKGNTGKPVTLNVYGYAGDGIVSGSDATKGTLIGSLTISVNSAADLKVYSIELNKTLIQQLLGTSTKLGLVLRSDSNGNALQIDSLEGPVNEGNSLFRQPALNLNLKNATDDAVFMNTTTKGLTVARSNGTSFTTFTAGALAQGITFSTIVTGDFNGDGRIDIAGLNKANGQWLVAQATAQQFVTGAPWTSFTTATTFTDIQVGDFNGDGRDDLIGRSAQGQLLVATSTGITFTNKVFATLNPSIKLSDMKIGDFNGDGRDDVAFRQTTTGIVQVGLSTSSNTFAVTTWGTWSNSTTWSDVSVGDFNGDGRDDLFGKMSNGTLQVSKSTGASFTNANFGKVPSGQTLSDIRVGDFNGDGKSDLVGRTQTNKLTTFLSTGNSFTIVNGPALPALSSGSTWSDVAIGDFNRDGKDDIISRLSTTATVNGTTTTTQKLYVSLGASNGIFATTQWGTFTGAGPFTILGVGNF
jgi:hypothetical protein